MYNECNSDKVDIIHKSLLLVDLIDLNERLLTKAKHLILQYCALIIK